MAKKHTGKMSKHHHEDVHGGGKDGMAHASHAAMNKAHGTPMGMSAAEEYGGHENDTGLKHASSHGKSMTESYHGSDGQGIPGDMAGNDSCD